MLKFTYNKTIDVFRRPGNIGSASYSWSVTELNEPQYGPLNYWEKVSASMPVRIESMRKGTQYNEAGERQKLMFLMYIDKSDSRIWQQDRIVDLSCSPGESPSMYVVDKVCDEFDMMGNVSHYEAHLTTP